MTVKKIFVRGRLTIEVRLSSSKLLMYESVSVCPKTTGKLGFFVLDMNSLYSHCAPTTVYCFTDKPKA